MGIISDFQQFLKEYKIAPLAIAFIIGVATTQLVQSLVTNIIMPIITPFIPGGWETATLTIGAVKLSWGAFLSSLINFIILALVIFLFVKLALKEEKVSKK